MSIYIEEPGMFTLIQDLGRWGFQSKGLTVSEPMDIFSLRIGNELLGNDENAAAMEILLFGPEMVFKKACCIALTGADLGLTINGSPAEAWKAHTVEAGDKVAVTGMTGDGCRAYLCVSGGIDVPLVMGSRSTYTRAQIGGKDGRPLQMGDELPIGPLPDGWEKAAGFGCPEQFRGTAFRAEPLYAMDGPQVDAFTEEGLKTFYSETYTVADEVDRMGYRLDGPEIARFRGADIISDGIVFGSVQVPGSGTPIVMMADRQTAGGYTKIAVVSTWSVAQLAQKLPGEPVRFARVSEEEATNLLRRFEDMLGTLREQRKAYVG